MNITEAQKPAAFAALYNASRPLGMGFLLFTPQDMTLAEAKERLAVSPYVDYHKGRVIKVDFSGDELDFWAFDRDNGDGAGERAVSAVLR